MAANAAAVIKNLRHRFRFILPLALAFGLSGCGGQVSFEKKDLKGHVRVERDGKGYCFKVPKDWEIRENLESAEVVCLSPGQSPKFRESIIGRSLPSAQVKEPASFMEAQTEALGKDSKVLEPWSGADKPVVLSLNSTTEGGEELGQLLFLHIRPSGEGVLFICTTTLEAMPGRREFFEDIFARAKYDLADCTGPGGIPSDFPTPEVTFSPAP